MRTTRFSVLFLFIFLYNNLIAQEASEPSGMYWLIRVNYSPDYCYRTVFNNDGSESSAIIAEMRDEVEQGKFGYTTGLTVALILSGNFSIETGLQYSNKGYSTHWDDLYFGDPIDPRYNFVYDTNNETDPIDKVTIRYNYNYLDIPIRIIYQTGKKNVSFIGSVGFATNILLSTTQTTVIDYENGDRERKKSDQFRADEFETVNISPMVSAGVAYKLSDKFSLRAEPTFRYGVMKISDTPVSAHLWNCGLNFSCVYAL